MLRLLSGLSPAVLLILGAAPGAVAGWMARGIVVDHIEIPRVITHQVELCTARVEKAAADAVAAEQLRRFKAGELATEQFIREAQAATDDRAAERDVLEMEIERYVQRMADRDGGAPDNGCSITVDDLDLLGMHVDTEPQPGGR